MSPPSRAGPPYLLWWSEGVVRHVCAPDVTQRVGDLAARGASGQSLLHGQENVVSAGRSRAQGVQSSRDGVVVPFPAKHRQALTLVSLDHGVGAQRLKVLFLVHGELVEADDGARAPVDLEGDAVCRLLDLGLLEALFDRRDRAAAGLHL